MLQSNKIVNSQVRILYDLSYATRGASGVPSDTKSVARMLSLLFEGNCEFVLFPKFYVPRGKKASKEVQRLATYVGIALRPNVSRNFMPPVMQSFLSMFQSISLRRTIQCFELNQELSNGAYDYLKISDCRASNLHVANISSMARFARPKLLKSFKIKTKDYDFFIQQQIDPISVSSNTKHIVRLHDILPITHPQFFDSISVETFRRGLEVMLKNKKIIWVFDSQSTSMEFQKLFGTNRNVKWIPCEVGSNFERNYGIRVKVENLAVMINTIEPRKNIIKVIEAFKLAKSVQRIPDDYKLVILGTNGWSSEELYKRLLEGKFGADVIFVDSPSRYEIANFLQRAKILVSASVAEGFGLPPLEGMLFGCIPVVSDIPQHRETVGDYGFFFGNTHEDLVSAFVDGHTKASRCTINELMATKNYVEKNFHSVHISKMWKSLLS